MSWIANRGGIAAVVAITVLAGAGAARADDLGLIDDSTYESPTFGFRVEWDQSWELLPDGVRADDGVEGITLAAFDGILQINASGLGVAPWEMIRTYADPPSGSVFAEFEVVEQGDEDGVYFVLLTGELEGEAIQFYTETREITTPDHDGPVLIATSLILSEAAYDRGVAAAGAVELDGEPVLVAPQIADVGDDDETGETGTNTLDHERDTRNDEDDDDDEE